MKYTSSAISLLFCLIWAFFPAVSAVKAEALSRQVTGAEIRPLLVRELSARHLSGVPEIRDSKIYFRCSGPVSVFVPENNVKTARVSCAEPSPRDIYIRTGVHVKTEQTRSKQENPHHKSRSRVKLTRAIAAGEILTAELLTLETVPKNTGIGGFSKISDILGRKVKQAQNEDTLILARHLVPDWAIEKSQQVVIENNIHGVLVRMSGVSLENGNLGDMIKVRNISSDSIVEGYVLNNKKISLLTKTNGT